MKSGVNSPGGSDSSYYNSCWRLTKSSRSIRVGSSFGLVYRSMGIRIFRIRKRLLRLHMNFSDHCSHLAGPASKPPGHIHSRFSICSPGRICVRFPSRKISAIIWFWHGPCLPPPFGKVYFMQGRRYSNRLFERQA